MAPSEQERATAWVTPALVMANTNAVSRQPEENAKNFPSDTDPVFWCITLPIFCPELENVWRQSLLNVYKGCPNIAWLGIQERLTTIDNFAKNCWAVGGRAVPAAVAELPLALLYGSMQPSGYGMQDARILPYQPPLAAAQ